MDRYQETRDTWNKVSELYAQKFMDLSLYDDTYDTLISRINQPSAQILDLGCGPGNITKYLMTQQPAYQITGIDVAPKMIALARSLVPNAHFIVLDGRNIDQLDGCFDAIVCGFCLPYLSDVDRGKLIQDCFNKIHEGGYLYISFVDGNYRDSDYQTGSSGGRIFFYLHPYSELRDELISQGFIITDTMNKTYVKGQIEDEIHTIIIAQKF